MVPFFGPNWPVLGTVEIHIFHVIFYEYHMSTMRAPWFAKISKLDYREFIVWIIQILSDSYLCNKMTHVCISAVCPCMRQTIWIHHSLGFVHAGPYEPPSASHGSPIKPRASQATPWIPPSATPYLIQFDHSNLFRLDKGCW